MKAIKHIGAIAKKLAREVECKFTGHKDSEGNHHPSSRIATYIINSTNAKEEVHCHHCGERYKRPASQDMIDAFYGTS